MDSYSNLFWSLSLNPKIKNELLKKYGSKTRYLKKFDKLILDLINSKCENIQEKMKEADNMSKFLSIISELKTARFLFQSGMHVELLRDNYFPSQSPDILYVYNNLNLYIEVTRLSENESVNCLMDSLRILSENFPYRIDIELKSNLSLPRLTFNERTLQEDLVNKSIEQFKSKMKSGFPELPIETDGIIFRVSQIESRIGEPGTILSVDKIPIEALIDYIKKRLVEKAKKRNDFKGVHRKSFYIIAFDCEESAIDENEIESLLYGRPNWLGSYVSKPPEKAYEWRQKEWKSIIDNSKKNSAYHQIEQAKEKGWESFLLDKNLIPNNYCNRNGTGLFLSEPELKNVSGILFIDKWNKCFFYPNPFCYSEINYPDIQKIFSFEDFD